MDNLESEIQKMSQDYDRRNEPYRSQGIPYQDKLIIKERALRWLKDQQHEYPELRSLNLYMSNKLGYETIKVYALNEANIEHS